MVVRTVDGGALGATPIYMTVTLLLYYLPLFYIAVFYIYSPVVVCNGMHCFSTVLVYDCCFCLVLLYFTVMVIIVVVRLSILLLLMLIVTLLFILIYACDLITKKVTCKVIREITFSFNYFCFKKNV